MQSHNLQGGKIQTCSFLLQMNVMVISDYGISDTSELYDIVLEDYIDMGQIQYIVYSSGYAAITPYALKHEDVSEKSFSNH